MTRTMFDSTQPRAIPITAQMVAYYVDGIYRWLPVDLARFSHAVQVPIAVFPWTNAGVVLDVEQGDATPAQAPPWVRMRRAAGIDPSVYCNFSTWPAVQAEFARQGIAQPHYWIAHYGPGPVIPAGAVAVQYADPPNGSGGQWDISAVADYWPGVDQGGTVTNAANSSADNEVLAYLAGNNRVRMPDGNSRNVFDCLSDTAQRLIELHGLSAAQGAQIAGLVGAVAGLTSANAANQPLTKDQVATIVQDAVVQHMRLTATVQIAP